jgi:hypothetical protein
MALAPAEEHRLRRRQEEDVVALNEKKLPLQPTPRGGQFTIRRELVAVFLLLIFCVCSTTHTTSQKQLKARAEGTQFISDSKNVVIAEDNVASDLQISQQGVLQQDTAARANQTEPPPRVERKDLIMSNLAWANPIVLKEYKLIFFPVPKVACSEWKQLLRKMMGLKGKIRCQYSLVSFIIN